MPFSPRLILELDIVDGVEEEEKGKKRVYEEGEGGGGERKKKTEYDGRKGKPDDLHE